MAPQQSDPLPDHSPAQRTGGELRYGMTAPSAARSVGADHSALTSEVAIGALASAKGACRVHDTLSNGSRLSCGRNAHWRKAAERQKKRLGGEATQFFPTRERPPASSAC